MSVRILFTDGHEVEYLEGVRTETDSIGLMAILAADDHVVAVVDMQEVKEKIESA